VDAAIPPHIADGFGNPYCYRYHRKDDWPELAATNF
jgi:hypothetical protein